MAKQELRPDQKPEVQPPAAAAEKAKEAKKKEPTVLEEFEEAYRKLEKAKNILHTAGNIEVGQTPHEILAETRTYRLLHYQQMVSKTAKTPILVVYALINKSYVLDLQPDKSWIRSLLSQGFDVYLIDWKAPTAVDKYVTFDDYVNCYIDDCVNIVLKKTKADKLTLHGYCMGATMSTMYTTLHQEKVRNLAVIAPVVDTEKDTTVIGNLAKNIDVDKMVSVIGNLPVEQLYACYSALKPFKQGVNKYFNLVQNIDNDQFVGNFLRLEKWLYDTPPIAGETFRQWIADIYQKNLFVKNELKLGNELIDLSKIKVPLLNIVADEDHLVSPQCSAPLNDVVSSTDKRLMRFHTGHVGLIASLYSQNNVLPKVGQWLKARSQ
ncbi:poly(R)-hydroxyalkanoic acid synthase [Candidatus Nitrososphaera gargensis Ga9.2]|uniref:Poly(3-hydroxyalkanoate) polymerase subunit PhaC n=1 Tax=Nitrososphaera gargensis (strain Ga9.2) TaxID=1237085 RepID=K0IN98_NITGG|nr:class III poly(R)-hydroxyalkanoic acid synthase subunit PhaC [Candidatus Nitrososphaera gargensis]AFU58999.1 poly(R)-hydroxyalkanoic acid synthase [Candidatus Nitrososphaera gargensis Ga9.2]